MFAERREWDSNPRALSDKRFSRPPRYDLFDISPSMPPNLTAKIILSKRRGNVNNFFYFFLRFFSGFFRIYSVSFLCFYARRLWAIFMSSGVVIFIFS